MKADFYEEGAELVVNGEVMDSIYFIEKGSVDLFVYDKLNNQHHLETLRQGATMGMYSCHFNKESLFTAVARKKGVKVLTIDQHFFLHYKSLIDGMDIALYKMEQFVKTHEFPFIDFKAFDHLPLSRVEKERRAMRRFRVLIKGLKKDHTET